MIEFEDRDDEGREMLLRYLAGQDPWARRRPSWGVWVVAAIAAVVNLGPLALMLVLRGG